MSLVSPSFDTFNSRYDAGERQLVWLKRIDDIETPITASLKLQKDDEPFFLLESVEGGKTRGRYSIIGLKPDHIWKCENGNAYLSTDGQTFVPEKDAPLESFRRFHRDSQLEVPPELPPSASGIIGYMSYDAIRLVETCIPDENPDTIGIPTGLFMRPRVMLTFDSVMQTQFIVAPVYPKDGVSAREAYDEAISAIESVLDTLNTTPISSHRVKNALPLDLSFDSNFTKDQFTSMVDKAKSYIVDGDIFQVVPSQRFKTAFKLPPFSLYRSLRHLNPSPFLFYLNLGEFQLVGSSPEIMVRVRDGKVTIRPLAGTRKRGKTPQEDAALTEELLHDEKEIAEHLMLVDLSRNDVGRVSKPGTVTVTEKFIVEYYSHVMHISSNVEGDLSPEYDALDALFAGLPVGTVSGAPKIRSMQIIDELEPEKRSYYAGCVGYLASNGSMDTCITLRTALIKNETLYLQAGCGIVADSHPDAEYDETINKAKALMEAAAHAPNFV